MSNQFQNRDGWWNKYIKNTGPVEYKTLHCRPHWQCIKCDFNDEDIDGSKFRRVEKQRERTLVKHK